MNINLDIPEGPGQITADWLTEALLSTKTIHKTRVESFDINFLETGPGYLGQVARFTLNYTQPEEGSPPSLMAKLASADQNLSRSMQNQYSREVNIYQGYSSQISIPMPTCYYCDINLDTGSFILLLEDLSNFEAANIQAGCNEAEAYCVIRHLARFHAEWWNNPRLREIAFLPPFNFNASHGQKAFIEGWSRMPAKLETLLPGYHLPPAFLDLGYLFGPKKAQVWNYFNQDPVTFIHNDVHAENLFFKRSHKDISLKLIDWQRVLSGRSVCDVSYFLISSLPINVRRKAERRLLKTYHDLLCQYGVEDYSFEQCWDDYLLGFFIELDLVAVMINFFDLSHPHGIGMLQACLTRIIAFSEDYPVIDYL